MIRSDAVLRKGFFFSGEWTIDNQNNLLAGLFKHFEVGKA